MIVILIIRRSGVRNMKSKLWRAFLASPLFLAISLGSAEVLAQDFNLENTDLNQVTNVNQLRDVSPSDWALSLIHISEPTRPY